MSDSTERGEWRSQPESSPADRLIGRMYFFFLTDPVAASAVVLMLAGALSGSGLVAWIAFAVSMLVAAHLRHRHERSL